MKKKLLCLSILMAILLCLTPSPYQAQDNDSVRLVTGIVYRDGFLDRAPYTDSNGEQDLTETPIQGVQLRVVDEAGNWSETVTTGEDGKYSIPIDETTFQNGMAGLSVEVLNPNDPMMPFGISQTYVASTETIVGNDVIRDIEERFVPISTPFDLTNPGRVVRNFGFRSPILTVIGKIYNDTDGNSEFNGSDTGVADRTVTIKDTTGRSVRNANGEELSIVTGTDGAFTV